MANLGIIHRAIKSAGRRYAISLLVNCTGDPNFPHSAAACCIPTMPAETSNTFFLSEKEKIFNTKAIVTYKRSAAVAKKLTNYEHLALSKTKTQTQVALGLH